LAAALALMASLANSGASEAARPRFIDVDLIAETAQPKPGGSALVGLRMIPKPGWHSYWTNPGEAGFPTVVEWKAPSGVHFGPLRHPAPSLIQVAGMASYVHEGPHVLVAQMSLDRDIPAGTVIPVTADVSWAACSEKLCVPEKATLTLQLTAGNGARSAEAVLFRRAAASEPRRVAGGGFDVADGKLLLELPATASLNAAKTRFFPDENGVAEVAKARAVSTSPIRLSMPAGDDVPGVLAGVATDGSSAYRLQLERKTLPAAAAPVEAEAELPQVTVDKKEAQTSPAIDRPANKEAGPAPGDSGPGIWAAAGAAVLAALSLLAFFLFRRTRSRRA
jgi:DsbC/DsbD-like thiol-disulfide interchange protein